MDKTIKYLSLSKSVLGDLKIGGYEFFGYFQ